MIGLRIRPSRCDGSVCGDGRETARATYRQLEEITRWEFLFAMRTHRDFEVEGSLSDSVMVHGSDVNGLDILGLG
jgi:hypothetical protein